LTGLPTSGRCPECGFAYDSTLIVLQGWGVGQHANAANARRGRAIAMLLAQAGLLAQAMINLIARRTGVAIGFTLVWIAFAIWGLWRRKQLTVDADAPVQLRLGPQGFAQRDGHGRVELHPWTPECEPTVTRARDGCHRVVIYRTPYRSWKLMTPAVECEVEIDDAVARELLRRIGLWIASSGDMDAHRRDGDPSIRKKQRDQTRSG
jgi:hypothetical protein